MRGAERRRSRRRGCRGGGGARPLRADPPAAGGRAAPAPCRELELSFSQLHDFEVCPVRYRFSQVWGVPAPPDELLAARSCARPARASSAPRSTRRWRPGTRAGGDLLAHVSRARRPGARCSTRYLAHPLARRATLGVEVEFNLRLGGARVRGSGRPGLRGRRPDDRWSTTRPTPRSTTSCVEAYSTAAPAVRAGGPARAAARRHVAAPRAVRHAARRGDRGRARRRGGGGPGRGRRREDPAGDFALGPEHAERPCTLCAFRPICTDRRAVSQAPPLEERYFERRQIREAIAFAEAGGIAVHRNFDSLPRLDDPGHARASGPFLHVIGLRPRARGVGSPARPAAGMDPAREAPQGRPLRRLRRLRRGADRAPREPPRLTRSDALRYDALRQEISKMTKEDRTR